MSGEKTEAATPKRRKDARKKGDQRDKRDVTTAAVMVGAAAWTWMFGGALFDGLGQSLRAGFRSAGETRTAFLPGDAAMATSAPLLLPLGALFAICALAAVAATLVDGGPWPNWATIQPKGERINPLAGLKRIFSMRGIAEFGKSIAKLALLGGIVWLAVAQTQSALIDLARGDPGAAVATIGRLLFWTLAALAAGLVAIAAVDLPIQVALQNKRLMMSRQEVRDEHRESEQAPEMRHQQNARRSALLDGAARKAVNDATVILVNPTSFAVALRYRVGSDAAPVVLARARDEAAQALRDLAREANVPILAQPAVCRAIYFTSRSGQFVDDRLYRAVATILAFVFSLQSGATDLAAMPVVDVPDGLRYGADGRAVA